MVACGTLEDDAWCIIIFFQLNSELKAKLVMILTGITLVHKHEYTLVDEAEP